MNWPFASSHFKCLFSALFCALEATTFPFRFLSKVNFFITIEKYRGNFRPFCKAPKSQFINHQFYEYYLMEYDNHASGILHNQREHKVCCGLYQLKPIRVRGEIKVCSRTNWNRWTSSPLSFYRFSKGIKG